MNAKQNDTCTLVATKDAHFNYEIIDEVVGGLVLTGAETKSLRMKNASLRGSFATITNGKIWVKHLQINHYKYDSGMGHSPLREKQVLLKASEIEMLERKIKEQSLQLVPIKIFTMGRWIKVLLGLGRMRKKIDKRNVIKDRENALRAKRVVQRY